MSDTPKRKRQDLTTMSLTRASAEALSLYNSAMNLKRMSDGQPRLPIYQELELIIATATQEFVEKIIPCDSGNTIFQSLENSGNGLVRTPATDTVE